jgi:flagellar hook assembly protein FlgD
MNAGYHTAVWDGNDEVGNAVSGGVYVCRIQAGKFSKVIRMLYMK